jgi:hypothetical protein
VTTATTFINLTKPIPRHVLPFPAVRYSEIYISSMPNVTICKSICNPHKPIGEICGEKKVRRSGMFCTPCRNNAIRLLPLDSELPAEHRESLERLYENHHVVNEKEKNLKNQTSKTYRSVDSGANQRKNQKAQNSVKKQRRAVITLLRESGDHPGLVATAYGMARYQNQQKTAVARGMDPNFDFLDLLADGNIHLLAAGVTDASVRLTCVIESAIVSDLSHHFC